MSMNNSDPMRNVSGGPSPIGNSGGMQRQSMFQNHDQIQLLSQSQPQARSGHNFPGHFQLSESRPQLLVPQSQYSQAHSSSPSANIRFQSPSNFQNPNPSSNPGFSNSNVPSPSVPTPGTGSSAKRANQKPPSRLAATSNPSAASLLKTMELTPAASRKKRKLAERQIPNKVASLLPESALYTQLLEFEERVDAILMRKKIEIQDAIKNPSRIQKILRIYVFNTFANQTVSTSEKKEVEPPSWTLKIIGRLLDDEKDPVAGGIIQKPARPQPKFSSFFKKITIYLDQNLYPDNHVILWESTRASALQEGFEVRRRGDKEFTAIIRLEMNYMPEKFKLSSALSEVLGLEFDTRPRIFAAIWFYVKVKKLQSPSDPSFFICDPPLHKLFGLEKVKFSMVQELVSQHLTPLQPIHLDHTIKLSGNSPAGTTCYDVLVDMPIPLEREMSAYLANIERHKEIDACDELISSSIRKIEEHRRRRAFFLGFSESPAEFINAMISSQSRDLKLAAGDASHNTDKEKHSEFYDQPWVEDAVIRYLNRKSAASEGP
ncbi:hypothetical protein SAY86_021933 [Trapa natans]|uniref:DM2 domain-containing protein n=1 Tax=Trapa natans TaxID=22666 RepID=A0AAN7MDK4_TRANT|nr:hypothetical protein SAY86_021933 [Trapa natans]